MPSPARPPRVSTPKSCGSKCPQGGWDDLECPPLCSGHFQRKEYFKFRGSETPAEFGGAKPLHLLTQTTPLLESPTGAFIAAQPQPFLNPIFTRGAVKGNGSVSNPSRENVASGSPQAARPCSNLNNSSAIDAQSATTTTTASGGNREELLGQWSARRKCRPRHDADAGCRNPISGAHLNRSAIAAQRHSIHKNRSSWMRLSSSKSCRRWARRFAPGAALG